ncbi:MAG: helix-turn-helix transcriptional regulator [Chloroflexi bacterium]|nr:MAG: helix-turn-helix transcriptional regulator [Chloroflexota bacterium]
MKLRLKVREIAESQGFNQSTLARKADVDFNTVKRVFRNPYRDVSISTLYRLSKALRVSLDELIEEIPDEESPGP